MENNNENVVLHPADLADQLTQMPKTERTLVFLRLPLRDKQAVFPFFADVTQQELIKSLGEKDVADLLNKLAPDDRTAILAEFPDELVKHTVSMLDASERKVALDLIGYEPNSIARLMTPYYIQTLADWTVGQTLEHIKKVGHRAETLNNVYVVDEKNKLIDDLPIGQLLMTDSNTPLSALMDHRFVSIRAQTTLEDGLAIFEKYVRSALPIVSDSGILVGIVTFDDVLDQIQARDTEDIQKFGGVEGLDLSYTKTPLLELVKKRAGWLIMLFIGEMLTASAMGYFDEEISKAVVLALFVPLIMSSGGNSGSQAASLIIRAMALGELKLQDWWYVMRKEVLSGLLLGSFLAVIAFIRIMVWQKTGLYDYGQYWFWLALSVSLSLVCIVLWGTLSGSLIPFVLRRFGFDPATASAPFVATLVDVTGLVIYFLVAGIFLSGKLL